MKQYNFYWSTKNSANALTVHKDSIDAAMEEAKFFGWTPFVWWKPSTWNNSYTVI